MERSRDGERRHATVLFADLSGFTALSEQRDPEDVATVVSGCLDALAGAVHDHGGHVDKYIGDCVMAVFGVPHAAENAATNAINAAIDMRKRLENLNDAASDGVRLTLHVGINTGLVVSGDVGGAVKREFTVMGDAVNVASRLKDTAGSMAIYVGAETYRETCNEFAFRKLPPLVVKGKAEPLTAYEVLSERERVYRLLPSERMVSSALVGRDRELGELRTAMRGVMEGRGAIVSVVGDAGIGKSRLLVEAADLPEFKQATVLQGRSLSMGSSLRFHPFVDLLRQWAAVAEDDDEPAAAARVEAAVAQVLPDVAEDVFPFIATLMGLRLGGAHAQRVAGIEPEGMEALIRKSMRELVQAIAASRPLALLFEDLHWADQSSVQLLESLLRLVGESRVLFVHVFRPDHDTTRRLLRTSRERFGEQHREIILEPLAALDCDLLVRNLLRSDDLPHAVSARVAQRAEGNPFYIEEVIRSWIDKGVVESAGGRLRITEQVHSVVIPGTVQEVIMARVDRLPDDTRRLLQTASVIGRSIYHRVLADVIGPDVDFDADVAYLKERQILFERRSRRTAAVRRQTLAEELEYVFKHALVQETVYQSILQRTRKELHRRLAESIERVFADRLADFFGMLAYHYSRAEELEKAEEYLFKAGDEAARSAASSEALHHFREASRVYLLIHGDAGDPKKRVLLEKSIAMALHNTGNLRESIEHFDRALSHLGDVVPRSRASTLAEFVTDLGAVLLRLYVPFRQRRSRRHSTIDPDVLEMRFNRARAETTSDPGRYLFDIIGTIRRLDRIDATQLESASAIYAAGAVFAWAGISFALGHRFLEVARQYIRNDNARQLFFHRSIEFICDFVEGNWADEREIDGAMVEQGLRYGQLWDVNTYLGLNCERKIRQGDFAAAAGLIDQIAQLAQRYGFDFATSNQHAMSAFMLLEQRRLVEALEALDLYYTTRHEEPLNLLALGTGAKIRLLLGDRDGAAAALSQAEALLRRLGRSNVAPYHQSTYLVSQFLFDLTALEELPDGAGRRGRWALARRARRSARQAVAIARRIAREQPEVYRLAGHLAWASRRPARAVSLWSRSLAMARRLGMRPELARTYFEAGQRLATGRGSLTLDGKDAAGCIETARALFEELGLEWDLARVVAQRRHAA